MTPAAIKALRKDLGCTARALADTLGVEHALVVSWESGERFPTKRHCTALEQLAKQGPGAIISKPRRGAVPTGLPALGDPRTWTLIRKLLGHPELFQQAEQLASRFDDPIDD